MAVFYTAKQVDFLKRKHTILRVNGSNSNELYVEKSMDNNNNKDLISKLEREIWLFEQWLTAIDNQDGDTQKRIKVAYQECIVARKAKLDELESQLSVEQSVFSEKSAKQALKA
jgi:hypothetical protein